MQAVPFVEFPVFFQTARSKSLFFFRRIFFSRVLTAEWILKQEVFIDTCSFHEEKANKTVVLTMTI